MKQAIVLHDVREIVQDTCGQDLVEYGLLASLIAVVAVAAVQSMGGGVLALWSGLVDALVSFFS